MAGGAGERFWPLSRIAKPKHLWNVFGGGKCILQQTIERAKKIAGIKDILIITNAEQVGETVKTCSLDPKNIIVEPEGRDTTAAIALASTIVRKRAGGGAAFAVLSADHIIKDSDAFAATLNCAFEKAESGDFLVSIGIAPTFAATGFGYIKRGARQQLASGECFKAERFFEKPNAERAQSYVDSGDFYWNAGMFVWQTRAIDAAIKRNAPNIFARIERLREDLDAGSPLQETLAKHYPLIEKISIDFSVMERADNVWVVPARFDWDDAGSWNAVERHLPRDENLNVALGECYMQNAKGDIIVDSTNTRATAVLGLDNIVVVHTADATLVCAKDSAEKLKDLVRALPKKFR